uniref:Uncharacterized protein n=1 Tax=Craspedostauros australis TaxID=1486917 RepID=A0A6T6GZR1_9STRA|mmetsp:Transcript_4363/g.11439  ORF Transcript_4363/g.11439 Transcript_4363/m.11439 type:complete len:120 (+) Transcript_4363:1366-1725(+)
MRSDQGKDLQGAWQWAPTSPLQQNMRCAITIDITIDITVATASAEKRTAHQWQAALDIVKINECGVFAINASSSRRSNSHILLWKKLPLAIGADSSKNCASIDGLIAIITATTNIWQFG